jgi:hypothetical protein
MTWKLIDISKVNFDNIVLKHPIFIANDENGHPKYTSEIWYKPDNGKPFKPIFKTPRVKVKYSCKKFDKGYGYCISSFNSDIDDEIKDFFIFVRKLDNKLSSMYSKGCSVWGFQPTSKNKYWSSVKKAVNKQTYVSSSDNGYIQLKVISTHNKDMLPLTKINKYTGEEIDPEQIVYGCYTDQLISISYLYYSSEGIRPVWYAHQIVVSESESVYLDHCLLNDFINPASSPPSISRLPPPAPQAPPAPPAPSQLPPKIFKSRQEPQKQQAPVLGLSAIQKGDLLNAIGRLRSIDKSKTDPVEVNTVSKGNLGISANMLKERKDKISTSKLVKKI